MANELLKTLTIDGVANDTLTVGDFLELDANNRVTLQSSYVEQTASSISVANNTALMSNIYIPLPKTDGLLVV